MMRPLNNTISSWFVVRGSWFARRKIIRATKHEERGTNHGFTLMEALLASVLLVSFMGAYLGTYHSFMSSAQQSKVLYQALSSCLSKFEEISGHDFGLIVADYNTTNFSIVDNFGNKIGAGLIEVNYAGSTNWTNATNLANWNPRIYLTSLVFDNKMWIMGGQNSSVYKNDVWYSTDGTSWTNATNSANWTSRYQHTSLVFDNKMWIMGGFNGSRLNDVWYSVEGKTWYNATSSANWTPRYGHCALVYDNKMWVMGGNNGSGFLQNDTWYSNNGLNWTNTSKANWEGRDWFAALVYDNKMWVMGGFTGAYRNDVWWTNDTNLTDGQTWTLATSNASWSPRYGHCALVYDNKMWVKGGYNGSAYKNDVWYSTNGANWTVSPASILSARYGHTALAYDNKMWVMGGDDGARKGDVLWSTGGNRLLNVSILASFRTPNNRTTGEDANLDGFFNVTGGEDKDNDGVYDTPVQLRALVSERKGTTFLGRP